MLKLCQMTGISAYVEPTQVSAVVMAYWGGSLVYIAGGNGPFEVMESPDTILHMMEESTSDRNKDLVRFALKEYFAMKGRGC